MTSITFNVAMNSEQCFEHCTTYLHKHELNFSPVDLLSQENNTDVRILLLYPDFVYHQV